MEGNRALTIEQAKEINIVSYLGNLGYKPTRISRDDYWFLSPLRSEHEASFKVNNKLNRWYDFGRGTGGNLIDLGILLHDCSVKDLLHKLRAAPTVSSPLLNQFSAAGYSTKESFPGEHQIKIIDERPLHSKALICYLNERKIPVQIASKYCREITYSLNNKNYFGIGFQNDCGGYEIRNAYVKLSSSPKDITTIRNSGKDIAVFEGFMDFLSFIAMDKILSFKGLDYLILNSTAFFEKSIPVMEKYEQKYLLLDNDPAGQNCSQKVMGASAGYENRSGLYKGFKDLNEWWMMTGATSLQAGLGRRLKPKIRRGL